MEVLTPRYSKEEFARRGDEIYEREIKPRVTQEDEGKFVVIDIETGDYEMDRDELVAHDRLLLRHPDASLAHESWPRLCSSSLGPPLSPGFEMIAGWVSDSSEAVIGLVVRGPGGETNIDAVIDTGFDGSLSLPPALISKLCLPLQGRASTVLAGC